MFNLITYINTLTNINNNELIVIDNNIETYLARYPNLYPSLNVWGGLNKTTRNNLKNQNRLSVRWLKEHIITRPLEPFRSFSTWRLATVFYNNLPIIIIRNNNNIEDPYEKLLILNKNDYLYSAAYLFEFIEADPGPDLEFYDKIGSYSGDVPPNIVKTNITKSYDLSINNDVNKLNYIIQYSLQYDY